MGTAIPNQVIVATQRRSLGGVDTFCANLLGGLRRDGVSATRLPLLLQYDKDRDPEHLLARRVAEDFLTEGNLWEPPKNLQVVGRKPYIRLPEEAELVRMVEGLRAEAEG